MPTISGKNDPEQFLNTITKQAQAYDQPVKVRLHKQLYDEKRTAYYSDRRPGYILEFKDAEEVRAFEKVLGLFITATAQVPLRKLQKVLTEKMLEQVG